MSNDLHVTQMLHKYSNSPWVSKSHRSDWTHCLLYIQLQYLSKKGSETRDHFVKAREERVLAKRSHYSHTNVCEVHEMCTTTAAVRMRIGIYTVRELRDNTVAMGLRFCLHKVVAKNRDQFATFFLTSTVCTNAQWFEDCLV